MRENPAIAWDALSREVESAGTRRWPAFAPLVLAAACALQRRNCLLDNELACDAPVWLSTRAMDCFGAATTNRRHVLRLSHVACLRQCNSCIPARVSDFVSLVEYLFSSPTDVPCCSAYVHSTVYCPRPAIGERIPAPVSAANDSRTGRRHRAVPRRLSQRRVRLS